MQSNLIAKDHAALVQLSKTMSPVQRLEAFLSLSRLTHQIRKAGKKFLSSKRSKK